MKRLLLALAIVFAWADASAAPLARPLIDHMKEQCNGVMGKDVCRVMNEAGTCKSGPEGRACRYAVFLQKYPTGVAFRSKTSTMVRFTADEYFAYVDAGESMCDLIERTCGQDGDGRPCVLATYLWRTK